MRTTSRWWIAAILLGLSGGVSAQTFGRIVPVGGSTADLALDERRHVVYLANFTANRVDVVSLDTETVERSINVPSQPSSLSLSPDGKYLVIAHYGNFAAPGTPRNALTSIDLTSGTRMTIALAEPPLGVAFGGDGLALVVTTTQFLLFDPVPGTLRSIETIAAVTAKTLPQPPANYPTQIVGASVAPSGDLKRIFGVTDTILFSYEVETQDVRPYGYVAAPPLGPRAISVSRVGDYTIAGWAMFDGRGALAQFPNPSGALNVGSSAIDSERGVVYAQVPEANATTTSTDVTPPGSSSGGTLVASTPPFLMVTDAGNLRVRERLRLPENLSGKGMLSPDGRTMYSLSDSGLAILPVGNLNSVPRIVTVQEDIVFRASFCNRTVLTQELTIVDPGGGNTPFTLSSSMTGVVLSKDSGVTPATIQVSFDPAVLNNTRGTIIGAIKIKSSTAVNLIKDVRIVVSVQDPDQRGTVVNVPGKLVDLIADPDRNRFFILRQDTNEVLVFDGGTFRQIMSLPTGSTPWSMAITFDHRYLLVGNDNSQYANVYDLDTLEMVAPVRFPFGHYPRFLASSGRAILGATRVAGPQNKIDRVDWDTRTAVEMPTLGVYENNIDLNTALIASTNGNTILAPMANGTVLVYNASVDTFTVARKDFQSLSGAYAASNFDQFVVGNFLLNSSGVPVKQLDQSLGNSSGFAFLDLYGFRTGSASGDGLIQRVVMPAGNPLRTTRMAESPVLSTTGAAFTRTVAPLADRASIVNLTVTGFTVLAWNYDAATPVPTITRVVNAADRTKPVAPGGLVIVEGQNLSPVTVATSQIPMALAIGDSCLTVNGLAVPMLMVSPTQINAQLPFQAVGTSNMILRTPGGVSDTYNLTIFPNAPSIFRTPAGDGSQVASIIRESDGQPVTYANPIRINDNLVIYLTGMGITDPLMKAGVPAPSPAPSVVALPTIDIDGTPVQVNFAGAVPGQIGVYQINAWVPGSVQKGFTRTLRITQGDFSTSVTVRVVE